MATIDFESAFHALTGNRPFPWLRKLYDGWFADGKVPPACNIPTGLGKTSVVAVWLIALANQPEKLPRRLVYVVNRRTVVDQTTNEVEKLRRNLPAAGLVEPLRRMCALPLQNDDAPLAVSTLRGQFADNREWSVDPARPAVVVGTVDMIGSRLLFSGYGVGFKAKPLHAGFLGQDALIVHDEAHLEPAFQALIESVRDQQRVEREQVKQASSAPEKLLVKVMALTATPRSGETAVELTKEEKKPPDPLPDGMTDPLHVAWRRLTSKKRLAFVTPESKKERVADRIGMLAKQYSESHPGSAILVFVNSLEDHATVCKALKGEQVQVLTGTQRGLQRDRMADPRQPTGCPIFARFLKPPSAHAEESERWKITPTSGTVYLVCTSAGEVGIDISADHMVCDLTAFDRMAQRFGRVNRFGTGDANIDIVSEATRDKKRQNDPNEKARWHTMELLKELPLVGERRSASPLALMQLREREDLKPRFEVAYTPRPAILSTSDILFDSWALTTIRGRLPGRPAVEPYLHGIGGPEPPETHVAWREEVRALRRAGLSEKTLGQILADYPLKSHELLRDRSSRVRKHLAALAEDHGEESVWLVDAEGEVEVVSLAELAEEEERIHWVTVVLPPSVGGLAPNGTLGDGAAEADLDVGDQWYHDAEHRLQRRRRVWDNQQPPPGMRLVRTIDTNPEADEREEDASARRFLHWYVRPRSADDDGSKTSTGDSIPWQEHTDDVVRTAEQLAATLLRECPDLHRALVLAARFHDLGKKRELWQRSIGNSKPDDWLAKSGPSMEPREVTDYRHEFGSLRDVLDPQQPHQDELPANATRDLVLHLIAAHHGFARPHFDARHAFDPHSSGEDAARLAAEVPQRFGRLQRTHGRWGLAYLESLLRSADWAASANPSAIRNRIPASAHRGGATPQTGNATPPFPINVDLRNPGQFFACCGLLELADRLCGPAEARFDGRQFWLTCSGTLSAILTALVNAAPDELTRLPGGLAAKPLIAPLLLSFNAGPATSLRLDAWTTIKLDKRTPVVAPNPPWNFWSGQQTSLGIWAELRLALDRQLARFQEADGPSVLGERVPLTGRFGFDPGAAWKPLDVGFSPNTQQMPVASSPVTEMLAAVGIQRFRPVVSADGMSFWYATWGERLSPSVAAAAAAGIVLVEPANCFRGHVLKRGQYAALGYSTLLNGVTDDIATEPVRPTH
jgi:CRISPR-associated endonuclease/helicase Cas3